MTVPVRPLSKLFNRVFKDHPAHLDHELMYLVDMVGSDYQDNWMAKLKTDDQLWLAIRSYLARGADINATGDLGQTVLSSLCEKDHPGTVAKMLAEGADPNIPDTYLGFTALMYAAMEANYPLMRALIDGGADAKGNTTNGTNSVAGFLLGNAGYKCEKDPQRGRDCLKLLLDHGVVLNSREKTGIFKNTPSLAPLVPEVQAALDLETALANPDPAALKAVLDTGVHADAASEFDSETALQKVIAMEDRGAHFDALVSSGADINLRSPATGNTPLQQAAQFGNREAFAKLLGMGADAEAPIPFGRYKNIVEFARNGDSDGMADFVEKTLAAHKTGEYATITDHPVAVHHSLHLQMKPAA